MGFILKLLQTFQLLVRTLSYYIDKGMCGNAHGLSPRFSYQVVYIDHKEENVY
jgi:hypothetical protein